MHVGMRNFFFCAAGCSFLLIFGLSSKKVWVSKIFAVVIKKQTPRRFALS